MNANMDKRLADIRIFLVKCFSDEELKELCFDHFIEVYQNFSDSESKRSKALKLIDYCHNHGTVPELLSVLRQLRPEQFDLVFGPYKAPALLKIDLNKATETELRVIPGIGPRIAQAIIYGRPYQTIEDLLRVNGIGNQRFEDFRKWFVV
jgi:competence ComEA-like helix-hairpin-helix protein